MVDKDIIEQITREVLQKLSAEKQAGAAPRTETGQPAVPAQQRLSEQDLARYIDHTMLKPEATESEITVLCDEDAKYKFYAVCVNTGWTAFCAKRLRGTGVKVCTVVGFPLGAMSGRAKGFEARHAIEEGANEIDMVINIGALKSGRVKEVEEDIRWVRRACGRNTVLKTIIEAALLTDAEKVLACQAAKNAGADFVKTSTGFSKHGATVQDVALMRRTVGPKMGVKAAGGVRSLEDALAMIRAGATRIGTSSGVKILEGQTVSGSY
ncbi:MAG: deoxyribose-phosphate aldolase [Spirochaetales bacterium]|nr:MAG: deoxyribose-phosphate aldolase [Spirochaetales bacterium]